MTGSKMKGSFLYAALIGVGVCVFSALALCLLLSVLILKETVPEANTRVMVHGITAISSFIGAAVAVYIAGSKRLLVCIGTGAIYFLLLLSGTALCFGGQYGGILSALLMTLCGTGVAVLIGLRKGNSRHKRLGKRRFG